MYYKIVQDGYVILFGRGSHAEQISKAEYDELSAAFQSRPTPPAGCGYRLKTDLTWELYELPAAPEDADPELTAEEALDIIVGGGADA